MTMTTRTVYKLFRVRKDGSLGPLFIGARQRIPFGEWLEAEDIPTKGFAHRPGWHCGARPEAQHLTEKGRVWAECEIPEGGYYPFKRPANQGGEWLIADAIKVNRILSSEDVEQLRTAA
jgi:hypothetical protein